MIKDVIETIGIAARKMLTNWRALVISFVLYAALLVMLYLFFTTREATTPQVLLSVLMLPLATIVLFFTLQSMGLSYVRIGVGPWYMFKCALKDCWRLLLVSLPLILLAWLIVYVFGKIEVKLFSEPPVVESSWRRSLDVIIPWLRILTLYLVLPLITIHLWISTVGEGLAAAFKGVWRSIVRAFAPRSVLIYILIVAVFGAIVYFLFFTKTPAKSEWTELWLFGTRLAIALLFVFLGWFLTLGSLAEMAARNAVSKLQDGTRI